MDWIQRVFGEQPRPKKDVQDLLTTRPTLVGIAPPGEKSTAADPNYNKRRKL